ncbi:MAG: tetratricopeptide repeat protein [bacterium]|nr:tetratricopeptide repeat protein [bacterium]
MMLRRTTLFTALSLLLLYGLTGCVYYNTFYNAKKEFNTAEKMRKQSGTGSQSSYKNAIEKSLKVLEDHPNSKYYDDALYVVGASYYHTQQYSKAERRFRELLANFPESEFARQSMVYLAQSKLKLSDHDAAIELFEEIFAGDYDKSYKADAAMELGLYHAEEKDPERARGFFLSIRDSLGNDQQKLTAQSHLADSYFDQFAFSDALKAYLQILGMKPDKNLKYRALHRSAVCSYRLQRINTGLDYLDELAKDQIYYDSLGAIKLTKATGYEYLGDLSMAEATYEDVISTSDNNNWSTIANYQLGLIYQFDYDDLTTAKEYYDKAVRGNQSLDAGKDAVQRSADIAKLQMIEAKQKANREADEEARKEALKKKSDSTAVPSATRDTTLPADSTEPLTDSVTVDSLFETVDEVDSIAINAAADSLENLTRMADSLVADSVSNAARLADSLIADSVKNAARLADSLIADSIRNAAQATDTVSAVSVDSLIRIVNNADTVTSDSLAPAVVPTDSLSIDSLTPAVMPDSGAVDSTLTDSTKATSDAEEIAQQSQRMKAMQQTPTLAKAAPTPEQQARADSIAAERKRVAKLEADADIIFQLAELYWFQLNKPDSAIAELKGLISDYSTTSYAPRAMLALSTMYREHLTDTLGADSILQEAYRIYANTDYAPEILGLMGKVGTTEDKGYPEYYYRLAENYLIDSSNADSARYYYQYIIDSFPNSSLGVQARFNIAYILENYQSPGDSSVIFAYEAIIDSFPGTPQAQEAEKRITYKAPAKKQYIQPDKVKESERDDIKQGDPQVATPIKTDEADTTGRYIDPKERIYKGPKDEQLILLDIKPIETRIEFDYPAEASSIEGYQFEVYFQILLDFSGKVIDFELKSPAPHDEINRRAELTVGSMSFDPLEVNKELTRKSEMITLPEDQEDPRGRWYVYKYIVEKPDYLK